MSGYLVAFALLWLYRYVRLIVNCVAHWTFRPYAIPVKPSYTPQDVTVIIPTLDGDSLCLRETVASCLQTNPHEIILTTIDANYKRALQLAAELSPKKIKVCAAPTANKRSQLCEALPYVTTDITVLADDDVIWPSTLLPWILAPFESLRMGGVGTCQRLRRAKNPTASQRFWNFLGALYLERRNFDISACVHMDGGLPCLSGRTVAYRTGILQDWEFRHAFTHEEWCTCLLYADDDNFMTRWMLSHGYDTYVQYHRQAEVLTTLEDNSRFLKQCLRWSRSNWRSNLTSMFVEGHVWRRQPWSTYAVQLTTLTAWAAPNDAAVIYLLWKASATWPKEGQWWAMIALAAWMFLTKWIKLVGHYIRYPVDVLFLPVSIVFGYLHGVLKLYAMLTLHITTWGSRENADADDSMRMIRRPPYSALPLYA